MKAIVLFMLFVFGSLSAIAQSGTVYDQMRKLQSIHHVHFIYESDLNLKNPYRGKDVRDLTLKQAFEQVFSANGIRYERHGSNILLSKEPSVKPIVRQVPAKPFRLKGIVRDSVGETLINVSLFDRTSKTGTLTDERGHYTLFLDKGEHVIDVSWFGQRQKTLRVNIQRDMREDIVINSTMQIKEVVVSGDVNSPLNTTQTGKLTLRQEDIKTEFSLLSSPDLVKTLQQTSGVAQGAELSGGLLVHGGNADENLFLLDGTPIYQTNHSLGLFSAFNADIIKNVDFYKSGFPARYSGRVSSITDVRTKDGNMYEHHGTFSLGLIDGRLQFEGPIVKGKTSYNVALRRSWIDLLLVPAYAIINRQKDDGEKFRLSYAFHDFNAKITHRLGNDNKLWLSLYSGRDRYGIKDESNWNEYRNTTDNKFNWGNLNVTLAGDFQLSKSLSNNTSIIGTYSYTNQNTDEDDLYFPESGIRCRNSLDKRRNKTKMHDIGIKTDFLWMPLKNHSIRFGGSFTFHHFNPQTTKQSFFFGDPSETVDTTDISGKTHMSSNEVELYAEDDITLNRWLTANIGASNTSYHTEKRTFNSLDPRVSLRWHPISPLTFKVSYTHMSQSIHRIASTFLDIPSDFWVPSTADTPPIKSSQLAAGAYTQICPHLTLSVEGYIKNTDHLLQYRHWMGLQPPAAYWESNVTQGKGKSYGLELDARYHRPRFTAQMSYTLSWSRRKFPELYNGWFYEQFDNRHRLNLSIRSNLNKRVSAYAAFTLRSGNRVSFPIASTVNPLLPGDNQEYESSYVYGKPNSLSLPCYHRLDVGFNFKHTTKKQREAIWNVSIYNAYCHLNTMYAKVHEMGDGSLTAKAKGYIPVIPSVSYTIKF